MTFGLACDRDGYDLRLPQCSQCGSRGCPKRDNCKPSLNTPEPNLPVAEADALIFWYKNYRGEEGYRRVIPISVRFGVSEWHGEKPQWLMLGIDTEKSVEREFAMSDMKNFVGPAVIRATPIPDTSAGGRPDHEIVKDALKLAYHIFMETGVHRESDERWDDMAAAVIELYPLRPRGRLD